MKEITSPDVQYYKNNLTWSQQKPISKFITLTHKWAPRPNLLEAPPRKKNILQHSPADQASYAGCAHAKEASWMKIFIQSRRLVRNMANVTWYELTFAVCIKSNSNSLYFKLFFSCRLLGIISTQK